MTATEIAARRDMERERFMLYQNYLAASGLYMAMIDRSDLFTDAAADAQYKTQHDIEDACIAKSNEYNRLYITGGTENN